MPHPNEKPLVKLFASGPRLTYGRGEILLEPATPPAGVLRLQTGHVKVYSIRDSGDLNVHLILKTGELFPLQLAVGGRRDRLYYEAMDEVLAQRVEAERLRDLVQSDATVARELLEQFAEREWLFTNRIENLELATAYQKVAYRLIGLQLRFGRPDAKGAIVIDAPITQQDIAESLNMIRETASREIEKLEAKGLVSCRSTGS